MELIALGAAAALAGLVRGFSGFGTAMIFLPVAGRVLGPFEAIVALIVMDIIGPIPLIPRAWRDADKRALGWLVGAMCLTLPIGLAVLSVAPEVLFRWLVSLVILTLLLALVLGLRFRGHYGPRAWSIAGGTGGVLGGVAGLPGPPIILLHMATDQPARVVRGNMMLYLVAADLAMLAGIAGFGAFDPQAAVVGAGLIVPYALAGLIGQRMFDPGREALYARVAYVIIGVAAIQGLPLWDGFVGA